MSYQNIMDTALIVGLIFMLLAGISGVVMVWAGEKAKVEKVERRAEISRIYNLPKDFWVNR